MDEQATHQVYEPPVLVEVGQFSEDTLGEGGEFEELMEAFNEE
ncbi:MAG: lasso RiPP family leader peptide-containing protein [Pseudonocardiaceae bacterium]